MPIHVALEQVAGPHVLGSVKIGPVHTITNSDDVPLIDRVLDDGSDAAIRPYDPLQVEDAFLGLSIFRSYAYFSRHGFLDQRSTSIKLLLPGPLQGVPPASIRGEEC